MSLEGVELDVDVLGDVLDVVGLVGLPQEQCVGAVRGEPVLLVEVRVAGVDDPLAGEETRMAMVGVEAIALPRIVPEQTEQAVRRGKQRQSRRGQRRG